MQLLMVQHRPVQSLTVSPYAVFCITNKLLRLNENNALPPSASKSATTSRKARPMINPKALEAAARAWIADWKLARYLEQRTRKRKATICRRKSDGTLWAASSPQNMGLAMRGLFNGKAGWHFARVRIWRGVPVVAPRLFWAFDQMGQFEVVEEQQAYWLAPWPEPIESAMIAAHGGAE
jgi:hypothetical protein